MSESNEHQSNTDALTKTTLHRYEAGIDLTDLGIDGYGRLQKRLAIDGIDIGDLEADRRYCSVPFREDPRESTYYTVLSDCGTVRITFQYDPHGDRKDSEGEFVGFIGISGTTREAVNTVVEAIVESATYVKDIDPDRAAYIRP